MWNTTTVTSSQRILKMGWLKMSAFPSTRLVFMSQILLYLLHSTSVLSFCIDRFLTLSIRKYCAYHSKCKCFCVCPWSYHDILHNYMQPKSMNNEKKNSNVFKKECCLQLLSQWYFIHKVVCLLNNSCILWLHLVAEHKVNFKTANSAKQLFMGLGQLSAQLYFMLINTWVAWDSFILPSAAQEDINNQIRVGW